MKKILLKYARYNQWANAIMLNLVKKEGGAWLDKEVSSSFSSIRKTVMHMADAEYIWYSRLSEMKPELILSSIPSKSGVSMDMLAELDQKLVNLIVAKEEDYFNRMTSYKNLKGDPFQTVNSSVFWQIFNHATFHRGQIITLMRLHGYAGSVESMDFIAFDRLGA
jgi:uncharacterized damage-inducible protein DinB